MVRQATPKAKRKKKQWITIVAPKLMNNIPLGECYTYDPQLIIGRTVTLNYMTLTGEARKQHLNVGFKTISVADGKAITEIMHYYIIPASLKRFVRKGREKVDDSFVIKTKDDRYVRIKPMLITNARTNKSVITNLRKTTKKLVQNVVSEYSYDKLVEEILTYKLQKYLRDCLHKVYPIKICEIRDFKALEKPPKKYEFVKEDISDIIAKSRSARKGKEPAKSDEPRRTQSSDNVAESIVKDKSPEKKPEEQVPEETSEKMSEKMSEKAVEKTPEKDTPTEEKPAKESVPIDDVKLPEKAKKVEQDLTKAKVKVEPDKKD
ncbi:MAG: hypothetical protein KKG59_05580 [Nanoarchaeota archaeon]|nr:hypothetical protein [Nanoarchaeota archaeon]